MKIYKTPGKQHNTTNKTIQTQGICKVKNGYTIRHTKNKTTYYYGAYKTLQEATKINTLLQQKKYPTTYSANTIQLRGEKYKTKLKKLLEEEQWQYINANGVANNTREDNATHNTVAKNADKKQHEKKQETEYENTEKNIHKNK